jgi:hypothetical protein
MQELNLDPKKKKKNKNLCPLYYSIQPNMHKRKHLYVILNAKTNSIGPNKGFGCKFQRSIDHENKGQHFHFANQN